MIDAIAAHVWQSTLFAGAALLLALMFRANQARVRYWIWLTGSLKFLVPFALLTSLGSHIHIWAPSPVQEIATRTPVVSYTLHYFRQPVLPRVAEQVAASSRRALSDLVITGIWGCGVMCLAFIRLRGLHRIRRILRASRATNLPCPVEVRLSPGLAEPAVIGLIRPVVLLPQGITERLTSSEMNAILAHEVCHVRRRDNLFAFFHMAVETTFWFHPLVWWLGARLLEEREKACDEDVVSQGNPPAVYAEAILNVCRQFSESPLACVSGVTGANLKRRIEAIMTNSFGQKLNRGRKVLLIASGVTAMAIPLVVGSVEPRLSAQSAHAPRPQIHGAFDVASVKPSHSRFADGQKGVRAAVTPVFEADHLTFRARGLRLFGLIVEAYGLKSCRRLAADNCPMLTGGPPWLTRDTFDIEAKSPSGSKEYDTAQLRNGQAPELQEELRNLLADRFHLKAHFEKRQLPVYAFTVAAGGIRMKKGGAVGASSRIIFKSIDLPGGMQATQVIAVQATVQELADLYAKFMDRPVVDATGLSDRFDFTVQYEVDTDATGPFAGVAAPTLFAAFEKQSGLKLRATRGPVNVLIVDSATRPSAN